MFSQFAKLGKPPVLITVGMLLAIHNLGISSAAAATLGITSIQYASLVDGADSTVNGITYLNQSLSITNLTTNSTLWSYSNSPQPVVILRRGGYSPPADDTFGNYNNRQVPSSERLVGDPETTVRSPLPTTAEGVLSQNNVFTAVDNVFVNAGYINGIQTDIERADFIFNGGLNTLSGGAIALFDRGLSTAHDGFQIAPILSIDGSGNPTSYGSLLSIPVGWGQTNLRPGGSATDNLPYTILTNSSGAFANVLSVNQQIGGILIPLSDFSATPTTIYGYSLFAPDVNDGDNPNNLLDWTNASIFPQNTPNSVGGLDLVAGSGFIVAAVPESSPLWGLLAFGSLFVGLKCKDKSAINK